MEVVHDKETVARREATRLQITVHWSAKMIDFFVHDNCFLRELVGVPNSVGDDRKE